MDRAEAAGLGVSVAGPRRPARLAVGWRWSPPAGRRSCRRRWRSRSSTRSASPRPRRSRRRASPRPQRAPEIGADRGRRARPRRRAGAARAARAGAAPRRAPRRRRPQPATRAAPRASAGDRAGPRRRPGLGDLDPRSFGSDPPRALERPPAAVMSAQAAADIASAISRQVQPCADRAGLSRPGAERIVTPIMLQPQPRRLAERAAAASAQQRGVDDENRPLRPARRRPRGQRLRRVRAAARPAAGAVRRAARLEQFHHELSFARMRM